MSASRRPLRIAALLCSLALTGATVSACGGEDSPESDDSPTASVSTPAESPTDSASESTSDSATPSASEADADAIDVTFSGDTVTPNGERVEAKVGEPVTFHITAEEAGELHVHSSPEQELEYPAGESDVQLTIDQPGIVDVESHALEQVIVQLEVR